MKMHTVLSLKLYSQLHMHMWPHFCWQSAISPLKYIFACMDQYRYKKDLGTYLLAVSHFIFMSVCFRLINWQATKLMNIQICS